MRVTEGELHKKTCPEDYNKTEYSSINTLEVNMNLVTVLFEPYIKPICTIIYIHSHSNPHRSIEMSLIKNIGKHISKS